MPTVRISKQRVDSVEAGASESFLRDDELRGFDLRTTSKGAKPYVLQYHMGGREAPSRRYTIDKHG